MLLATLSPPRAIALSGAVDQLPPDVETLFNAGQYHQATESLQTAVRQNPKDASLEYWLGRSFFEIHNFTQSISSFEQAVKLDPNRSQYHDWLGRACGRKADESSHSNMPAALRLARRTHHEFEVAVQLDGTNIEARRDLISFIANAPSDLGGGSEEALKQINALSAVDPVEGTLALGELYAVRKKFDQANEEYQKVLTSASNRVGVYLEVADYYRDRGDSEHMEQAVQAAEKSASSDRRLSYYRGVALVLEKGNPEIAEKDLRTYIDNVPENSEIPSHASAHEWLGKLFENEKRPDLAAQALDPKNKALREALKRLRTR
jgi:tetratricopeptide (TPR) repeat protein